MPKAPLTEEAYLEELAAMEAAAAAESSGGEGNFLRKASRRFSRIRSDPIFEEGDKEQGSSGGKSRRLSIVPAALNRRKGAATSGAAGDTLDMSEKVAA